MEVDGSEVEELGQGFIEAGIMVNLLMGALKEQMGTVLGKGTGVWK